MFGMKEDDALEDRMVSRQIEKAQRKVEAHNFDIRKHLLEFDDIANDQRKVIYRQRNELLEVDDVSETIVDIRDDVVDRAGASHRSGRQRRRAVGYRRSRSRAGKRVRAFKLDLKHWIDQQQEVDDKMILEHVREEVEQLFREQGTARSAPKSCAQLEKHVMLQRARQRLEGTSGEHGLSAPGHLSARLCAEAAEAGVQARSV